MTTAESAQTRQNLLGELRPGTTKKTSERAREIKHGRQQRYLEWKHDTFFDTNLPDRRRRVRRARLSSTGIQVLATGDGIPNRAEDLPLFSSKKNPCRLKRRKTFRFSAGAQWSPVRQNLLGDDGLLRQNTSTTKSDMLPCLETTDIQTGCSTSYLALSELQMVSCFCACNFGNFFNIRI